MCMSLLIKLSVSFSILIKSENIVLPPIDGKSGEAIGLIYITGADIYPSQYVQLCQTLQMKFPQPLEVAHNSRKM